MQPALDFNPRSPNGLRPHASNKRAVFNQFQSTQPEWAATAHWHKYVCRHEISIHAARMGCDGVYVLNFITSPISIHAARMGCDFSSSGSISVQRADFNPRSPNGLRPITFRTLNAITYHFNPRSPNGLRLPLYVEIIAYMDFNPRSPNGLRRRAGQVTNKELIISIHAARMGCDLTANLLCRAGN